MNAPLLSVVDLKKEFALRGRGFRRSLGSVKAVDGVSFTLDRRETLSLVGESGCGKSTTARCILRIQEPTSGSVVFDGTDIIAQSSADLRVSRRRFQMVFQDPQASLNPRMTAGDIISEPLIIRDIPVALAEARASELLDLVQLPADALERYPHEFSGGQRQRIGIARAIALNPDLVVLDEPVSALDVSIQAEIIRLLERLRSELGLAYLFIAHDLSVVRHLSDRVAVMYLGRIVEIGTNEQIYEQSSHPYTQALLSAAPVPDPVVERSRVRIVLQGDPPDPADPPSGCSFRTRCWKAQNICAQIIPPLVDPGGGHSVACHFPEVRNMLNNS